MRVSEQDDDTQLWIFTGFTATPLPPHVKNLIKLNSIKRANMPCRRLMDFTKDERER